MAVSLATRGEAAIGVNTCGSHARILRVFCRTIYHLATPALAALARTEHIYKDEKFSDHAPITVDYDFTL